MAQYIVISQEVAETNVGLRRGVDTFNYAVTLDGRYVCNANALEDFGDILLQGAPIITLTDDDFPPIVIDYP